MVRLGLSILLFALTLVPSGVGATTGVIAFDRMGANGTSNLWVMRTDGSGARQVTTNGSAAAWSPDGRRIAFSRMLANGSSQLWVMNSDGTHQRRLTSGVSPAFLPAWSPDGRLIAFESWQRNGIQIAAVRPDGRGFRLVTRTAGLSTRPSFSPDGQWIGFTYAGANAPGDLWKIRVSGRDRRRVTRTATDEDGIVWSPDGRWIAFGRGRSPDFHIWIAKSDGSGARQLTKGRGSEPDWAPDSTRLVYVNGADGDGRDLPCLAFRKFRETAHEQSRPRPRAGLPSTLIHSFSVRPGTYLATASACDKGEPARQCLSASSNLSKPSAS